MLLIAEAIDQRSRYWNLKNCIGQK